MQQSSPSRSPLDVYVVDDLLVDPARAAVTRGGEPIALPRLSFDTLVALVEAAPAVVGPDELMQKVWDGVIVSPETVAQRIKLLRAALGDDAHHPRYVAVVRGRGYRLVPDVRRTVRAPASEPPDATGEASGVAHSTSGAPAGAIGPEAASDAVPPAANAPVRARRSPATVLAIAALAVVVIAGAIYALRRGDDANVAPATAPLAERSIAVLPFENAGGSSQDEALATGVAEAVLHRLAGVPEMIVIARTSSFAVGSRPDDARAIGRRLGARFLLEGSLQRDGERLRVTAQLIDAESGTHLWSLQFDRAARDVFAMQDEIAARVADALSVSLATPGPAPAGPPRDFDAYLEYLQARSLLAGARVADLPAAIAALERATRRDPSLAAAYVALATARLQQAEYDVTPARRDGFMATLRDIEALVARAIELDPSRGEAHLVRARVLAFTDLAAAEAAYREGLRLAPSDAAGYEGLAGVVYQDPRRHDEALALLDRARRLSPLDPRFDVTKAVFLAYGRSDLDGATRLLQEALQKQPLYPPALARLGETQWLRGRTSDAIRHLEQAVRLDPRSEWARRVLVLAYLDVGDEPAARDVVASASQPLAVRELPLALFHGDWRRAADLAYEGFETDTVLPIDAYQAVFALRIDARHGGDAHEALDLLSELAGLEWDAAGRPVLPQRFDLKEAEIGAADLLALTGDTQRSRRLAERVLRDIEFESRELGRGDLWYMRALPAAHSLRGDEGAALAALQHFLLAGVGRHVAWVLVLQEPLYAPLRTTPEYGRMATMLAEWRRSEAAALESLRQSGAVPRRPSRAAQAGNGAAARQS